VLLPLAEDLSGGKGGGAEQTNPVVSFPTIGNFAAPGLSLIGGGAGGVLENDDPPGTGGGDLMPPPLKADDLAEAGGGGGGPPLLENKGAE